MKTFALIEIIDELIGHTRPMGETTHDNHANKNLSELIELSELIIKRIESLAEARHDTRHSVKLIGEKAYKHRIKLTAYEE